MREAQARCDQCGTMVCVEHYDRSLGYCADCAGDASQGGRTF